MDTLSLNRLSKVSFYEVGRELIVSSFGNWAEDSRCLAIWPLSKIFSKQAKETGEKKNKFKSSTLQFERERMSSRIRIGRLESSSLPPEKQQPMALRRRKLILEHW